MQCWSSLINTSPCSVGTSLKRRRIHAVCIGHWQNVITIAMLVRHWQNVITMQCWYVTDETSSLWCVWRSLIKRRLHTSLIKRCLYAVLERQVWHVVIIQWCFVISKTFFTILCWYVTENRSSPCDINVVSMQCLYVTDKNLSLCNVRTLLIKRCIHVAFIRHW